MTCEYHPDLEFARSISFTAILSSFDTRLKNLRSIVRRIRYSSQQRSCSVGRRSPQLGSATLERQLNQGVQSRYRILNGISQSQSYQHGETTYFLEFHTMFLPTSCEVEMQGTDQVWLVVWGVHRDWWKQFVLERLLCPSNLLGSTGQPNIRIVM